jgi:hypothetical protein
MAKSSVVICSNEPIRKRKREVISPNFSFLTGIKEFKL